MNNLDMIFGKVLHESAMADYDILIDDVADEVLNSLELDDNPVNDVTTYEDVYELASECVRNDPAFEDFPSSAAEDVTYRVGQKLGIKFEN